MMTVETSRTLQNQVDRRDVGNHQVEVHIKRLLHNLRGHDDARTTFHRTVFAVSVDKFPIDAGTIDSQEPGMVQHDVHIIAHRLK